MATRGRKPKPTAIKMLEGNPGKRPLNVKEPAPPKGNMKCPVWLLPEAKKEWKRLASSLEAMGVLTMVDLTAFAGYCQAYAAGGKQRSSSPSTDLSLKPPRGMCSRCHRFPSPSRTSKSCSPSVRSSA